MKSAFLNDVSEVRLALDLKQIYYDFKNLKFFDHYGTSCFGMAALLAKLLKDRGYQTRMQACYAHIKDHEKNFYLGYQGYAKSNQLEAHVVCIVDEHYLVDFGLGNVRKFYDPHFFRSIACELSCQQTPCDCMANLHFDNGITLQWKTDWISPMVEQELIAQQEKLEIIYAQYADFRRNRVAYLVRNSLKNPQPANFSGAKKLYCTVN